MGLNYSFKLYFHNEDVEKAILTLADMVWIHQKEDSLVTLPNGKTITIALRTQPEHSSTFESDEKNVIVRETINMLFLPDEAIVKYFKTFAQEGYSHTAERKGQSYHIIGNIWLKVRHSDQYSEFSFTAVTTSMSILFLESRAIHQRFLELLNAANGILGLIDVESWEYLLLDHPERGVFLDQTQFYDEMYDPDVDWIVSNILELKRLEEPIWQRQGDPASFRRKWIVPFDNILTYSKFIFWMLKEAQERFWIQMKILVPQANDEVVELLLDDLNKRYNIIGAFLVAFRRQDHFAEHIGKVMIRYPYNADVFCFALAHLGTPSAAVILESYLTRHIPINEHDPVWDELSIDWAIAALQHIDEQLGTQRAKNYMTDDGV